MMCGLMRAPGRRRTGRWHRAGAAAESEEDGPVMPRQGGSQGGRGRAVAVGRRRATTDVGSSRVQVGGYGQGGVAVATTDLARRAKGRESVGAHGHAGVKSLPFVGSPLADRSYRPSGPTEVKITSVGFVQSTKVE
jgi:hypothetical protein